MSWAGADTATQAGGQMRLGSARQAPYVLAVAEGTCPSRSTSPQPLGWALPCPPGRKSPPHPELSGCPRVDGAGPHGLAPGLRHRQPRGATSVTCRTLTSGRGRCQSIAVRTALLSSQAAWARGPAPPQPSDATPLRRHCISDKTGTWGRSLSQGCCGGG